MDSGSRRAGGPTFPVAVERRGQHRVGADRPGSAPPGPRRSLAFVTLSALGIVFGDLGTSPLYALQEGFHGSRGVPPSPENVIGIVSLFAWALILMVSMKTCWC